jgi:hypothetical protein
MDTSNGSIQVFCNPENQVNTYQLKMVQVRLENLKLGLTENILIWI